MLLILFIIHNILKKNLLQDKQINYSNHWQKKKKLPGLMSRSKTGTFVFRNSGSLAQSRRVLLSAGKYVVM